MTLVELVMAVGLIAICVGGIVGVILQSFDSEQSLTYSDTATNIAKSRIEYIRRIRDDKGYAAVGTAAETDTLVNDNGVPDPAGNFKRTTVFSDTFILGSTTVAIGITQVTVTVKYKRKGIFSSTLPGTLGLRTVQVTSYLSQYK